MHKSQVFFYLLSAFIVGVFVASFGLVSISSAWILAILGIAIIIFGFKNKLGLLVGFLVIFFAIGVLRFDYFNQATSGLDNLVGQEVILNGYIDSEPDTDGNRARFVFSAEGQGEGSQRGTSIGNRLGSASGGKNKNERILVTTNSFPRREFGDALAIRGELELPQNFTDFDYTTHLKKDGIRTTIFYPKEIEAGDIDLRWSERIRVSIYQNVFVIKNKFQNAINSSIPEPNAAFINGILLGTRQNISDDLKDAFSKTGTTHILAISGYNIMIISEAILLGLVWFFRRRVVFWISVGIIILFVILTGASASVVRAAVMGLLLSFARGYGRLYDQKNSIILAGAAMVWFNPIVLVFDIGFQLSFAAVLGLIYLYPWLAYKFYKMPKLVPILFSTKSKLQNRGSSISQSSQDGLREIGSGLKELILMTFSAQVAVTPLLIYYFGNFSLISLPTNVLILSFLPYAMLAGFIAGLSGMVFLPLGQFVGFFAWAITTYQIKVVEFFSSL